MVFCLVRSLLAALLRFVSVIGVFSCSIVMRDENRGCTSGFPLQLRYFSPKRADVGSTCKRIRHPHLSPTTTTRLVSLFLDFDSVHGAWRQQENQSGLKIKLLKRCLFLPPPPQSLLRGVWCNLPSINTQLKELFLRSSEMLL